MSKTQDWRLLLDASRKLEGRPRYALIQKARTNTKQIAVYLHMSKVARSHD
jgi:hypothetical protein